MHENIKRFYMEGEVKYEYLTKARKTLEEAIEDKMRYSGYIPVLDIDPQLTQEYDPARGLFKITVSVYGGYVGEDEKKYCGLMFGKPLLRHTPTHKSKESSTN